MAPWFVADSNDKRTARLNIIRHLLSQIPYEHLPMPEVEFPPRQKADGYRETDRSRRMVEDWYGKQAQADREYKEQRKKQKRTDKSRQCSLGRVGMNKSKGRLKTAKHLSDGLSGRTFN